MKKGAPIDARTCKHLASKLGAAYETARMAAKGQQEASQAPRTGSKKRKAAEEAKSPNKRKATDAGDANTEIAVLLGEYLLRVL